MTHRSLAYVLIILATITMPPLVAPSSQTQTQIPTDVLPTEVTKARLQQIVKGILAAWDKSDVVCLGEDHGGKNDSDLRITLVEHPDFIRKVKVIMVESANVAHQDILDRFILEGEEMSREKLRVVWSDASGAEVWESPIYEAFLPRPFISSPTRTLSRS
jgi:hypothetical protein